MIDNRCPNCGWFAESIGEWPRWNGRLQAKGGACLAPVKGAVDASVFSVEALAAEEGDAELAQDLFQREQARIEQIRRDAEFAQRLQDGGG